MSIAKLAEGQAHLSQVCNRLGVAIEAVRAREPLAPLDTVNPEDAQEAFTTLGLHRACSATLHASGQCHQRKVTDNLRWFATADRAHSWRRQASFGGSERCQDTMHTGLAQAELAGELSFSQIAGLDDDEATLQLCKFKVWARGQRRTSCSLGLADGTSGRWLTWGLQEAVRRLYQLEQRPDTVQMQEIAQDWRPWRSIAARVLWRWRDSQA